MPSNTIGAIGQQVSLFVPAGSAVRLNVSGTFSGTLSFYLNQGGNNNPVQLWNLSTGALTDTTATVAGSWLYTPTAGSDGTLIIQASAWNSGAAIATLVDLTQNPTNVDLELIPSAARTAQVDIGPFSNPCWRGIEIFVNVTAASGTGGLQPTLKLYDPVSGNVVKSTLTGSHITATGTNSYIYYPSAGVNVTSPLSFTWGLEMQVGDTTSYTYSVGASLLK